VFEGPEPDIELFTDEAKVSQVLRNFISNALKFTERGEVRVSVFQALNGALSFSVADTGIGIAEQDQERFQEWSQVEGKLQRAAKGSGLGLRSRASWLSCWVVTFSSAARRDWVRHLSHSFLLISMAKRK
jgi:signal transduction histidine kinase